jgi:hypothetical protein
MGRGEAFVLMCFLKNSSAIKEGMDGAHTMETSYKQELKIPKAMLRLLFHF